MKERETDNHSNEDMNVETLSGGGGGGGGGGQQFGNL